MHLHTVAIPAANPDEDVTAALARTGTLDALAAGGITTAIVHATLPTRSDDQVRDVSRLGDSIADHVRDGLAAREPVLVLGGNCNVLPGVLGGFQRAYGPDVKVGLVWFDAHGDFNTPKTTLTGRLGGMPVAAAAGLCFPAWREAAGMAAPLPTDRIVMVDVRNLDPKERDLIEATAVTITAAERGREGVPLDDAVGTLARVIEATAVTITAAERGREGVPLDDAVGTLARECDMLYLHIDEDILDRRYVPNHGTAEGDGPDMATVQAAVRAVLATGKVRAFGLVSVYLAGEGAETSLSSAATLLRAGLRDWAAVIPPASA